MSKNTLAWIRRRTSVDDLLDDGIENYSDLKSAVPSPELATPADQQASAIRKSTLLQTQRERVKLEEEQRKKAFSYFGLFLAALLIVSGATIYLYPVNMLVHHTRIRYLPSVVEHVTPDRSQLYGAALFFGGIALVLFSIYRPRK